MTRRVMFIFGTRPEAIKMAPIIRALSGYSDLTPIVVTTAQHRRMLDQVLEVFGISPDVDLAVIRDRQTLPALTARILDGLAEIFEQDNPDLVLVQGDTTSSFAGALAAFYARVPVAHVEAGLRTANAQLPFPEEMNRRLVGQLSSLHFAPTERARRALLREGISPESIFVTGNPVIDALLYTAHAVNSRTEVAQGDRDTSGPTVLLTAHRRESWGAPLRNIAHAITDIALARPDVTVICPMHLNPAVRDSLAPILEGAPNIRIIDPLGYLEFVELMKRADLILTDSGGVQEEAPSLGKPVLVLRDDTERPEAVEAGAVHLVGTDRDKIRDSALHMLRQSDKHRSAGHAINPYGDGSAATRIVEAIRYWLLGEKRPDDFTYAPPKTRSNLGGHLFRLDEESSS